MAPDPIDSTLDNTPRQSASVASAPLFRQVCLWWGDTLAKEADGLRAEYRRSAGTLTAQKAQACAALSMRMRALALEFEAVQIDDPGDEPRRQINARYADAVTQARELMPGREYGL